MMPKDHLLRRINVFATAVLADLHEQLKTFYSDIGRPSVDPELMIRMLLVGYCYGIRHERRLCQEVALHLAYRWFCKLDLDDKVPHHSTFSVNRLGRFRASEILRHIFERVVAAGMAAGLVKGEGFAVDASVMEANASRYHGKAPDELDWTDAQRQKRAVAEYLAGLEAETQIQEVVDSGDDGSDGKPTAAPDRKAAEGDLAFRSVVGVDGKSQQARPVRIWAQLSYRCRARDHCRCRGDAGTHL
jgi:transposase